MIYDVRITETRQVIVTMEAGSMAEASKKARESWIADKYAIKDVPPKKVTFETLYPNHSSLGSQPLIRLDAKKPAARER